MAILSESEFEAVLGNMVRTIDKIIYQRHTMPKLQDVRRQLEIVLEVMLDPDRDKPSPEQLKALTSAAESLRSMSLGDAKLEEDSFDIEDYVTYRL